MEHINIPDNQLHEPKGAASASPGSFYRANGGGSGNWGKLTTSNVQGMGVSQPALMLVVTDGDGGFTTKSLPLSGTEVQVSPGGQPLQEYLDELLLRVSSLESRVDSLEGGS